MMPVIIGPNFFPYSSQREEFCNSTPLRSLRIKPASRKILKCWDSVDFGSGVAFKLANAVQFLAQAEDIRSVKMRTRTGSDRAYRIPSTVISSAGGCISGLITKAYAHIPRSSIDIVHYP